MLFLSPADPKLNNSDPNHQTVMFEDREIVTYFWWYIVIGVIWMAEFANAIQELVVAGAVAEWFFTRYGYLWFKYMYIVVSKFIGGINFFHNTILDC